MFTKQHYEAIAKIIHDSKGKVEIAEQLCKLFAQDNSLFRPDMFLRACGIDPFIKVDTNAPVLLQRVNSEGEFTGIFSVPKTRLSDFDEAWIKAKKDAEDQAIDLEECLPEWIERVFCEEEFVDD